MLKKCDWFPLYLDTAVTFLALLGKTSPHGPLFYRPSHRQFSSKVCSEMLMWMNFLPLCEFLSLWAQVKKYFHSCAMVSIHYSVYIRNAGRCTCIQLFSRSERMSSPKSTTGRRIMKIETPKGRKHSAWMRKLLGKFIVLGLSVSSKRFLLLLQMTIWSFARLISIQNSVSWQINHRRSLAFGSFVIRPHISTTMGVLVWYLLLDEPANPCIVKINLIVVPAIFRYTSGVQCAPVIAATPHS